MEYRLVYSDELYHHGVKGMKWGVRKEASGTTQSRQITSDQRKDKLKKAVKVSAAVAGAMLVVYGSYKIHSIHNKATTDLGRKYMRRARLSNYNAESYSKMATEALNQYKNSTSEVYAKHYLSEYKRLTNISDKARADAADLSTRAVKGKFPVKEVASTMFDIGTNYKYRKRK